MKQHKDIYRLNHMLVHAREANELIAGKEKGVSCSGTIAGTRLGPAG